MSTFNEAKKILAHLNQFKKEIDESVTVMGVMAVNQFKSNFIKQGFEDETLKAWQPRKRVDRGRYAEKAGTRKILIGKGTGILHRSIVAKKFGKYAVRITSKLPYANIHNEGLMGKAFGKHSFKMPKRQFVGNSGVLNRKILKKIDSNIKKIFK